MRNGIKGIERGGVAHELRQKEGGAFYCLHYRWSVVMGWKVLEKLSKVLIFHELTKKKFDIAHSAA